MGMEVVLSSVSVSRARLHAVKLLLERQRLLLPERQVCIVRPACTRAPYRFDESTNVERARRRCTFSNGLFKNVNKSGKYE